ncbi:protein FAM234B isoform X2 [Bombina bombina]|uniref:protein FAM234B isoform X2 n=1 Tax=Bombina bombina TaxID=8345 RepID=UPI00235A8753|nr:protein FAM234B isoform X2 [Bombina bombina]
MYRHKRAWYLRGPHRAWGPRFWFQCDGKKSHDPREYDPLTQADSDESEDDLVINIQQNGGVQNGKGSRGTTHDQNLDPQRASKRVMQRPVESKQDCLITAGEHELEIKATSSLVSYVRTTIFLLTVIISMIMVLVCAFLIPCPHRDQHNLWTVKIGQETGVSSTLELFDVNKDGVPDILLSFLSNKVNASQDVPKHQMTVAALSGVNSTMLWSVLVPEDVRSIQCGRVVLGAQQDETCLLTGTSKLFQLISASSGKTLWTMSPNHVSSGTLAAPAVILPNLDEDNISDLLVLTIGEIQPDLGFLLVSGRTGNPLGRMVKYGIMGEGKLLGPQAHYISQEEIYILFGFGKVQAVSLRDIYAQATNTDSFPGVLQKKDLDDKRNPYNLSKLVDAYSSGVEFLQNIPSGYNSSDLLITTRSGLSLLRGNDLELQWRLGLTGVHRPPKPGHFNSDGKLDFLLQVQGSNLGKKIIIVDGTSGDSLWEWESSWYLNEAESSSVPTADGKSVFLFWGHQSRASNSSQDMSVDSREQRNQQLYLLCPTYPNVLLDLYNVSTSIVSSAVGINELEKDAFLAILSADKEHNVSDKLPRTLRISKLGMRWAVSQSQLQPVGNAKMRVKLEHVKRILNRLRFTRFP